MQSLATIDPSPPSAPPEESDARLMDRIHSGELAPAAELFRRHHRRIHAFCSRLAGRSSADDLTQEVFLRMIRYRSSWRSGRPLQPWLYQLARNVCIDQLRRGDGPDPLDDEPELPAREPLQDRRLDSRRRLGRLEEALAALPAEKREILVLARFEGLEYCRIAELMNCSVGAVKVRIHRALRQLKETVDAAEETPE